jgi:hypothetical protein
MYFYLLNYIVKYIYLIILSVFVISCGNNPEKEEVKKPKPLMSLVETHNATENINTIFLKEVKDWDELKAIDSFFVKFRKISPNEILSNAIELKDLIKNLKDSVKPKSFNILSLDARINILYTEALRLADLTEIGAIKAAEVNTQLDKTMTAFSNVAIKINTVLEKISFENEIDIEVTFIGLDTTKIDAISKKTIDLKFEKELINRSNSYKKSNRKEQL